MFWTIKISFKNVLRIKAFSTKHVLVNQISMCTRGLTTQTQPNAVDIRIFTTVNSSAFCQLNILGIYLFFGFGKTLKVIQSLLISWVLIFSFSTSDTNIAKSRHVYIDCMNNPRFDNYFQSMFLTVNLDLPLKSTEKKNQQQN